jgi:hypothetical protein
MYKQQFSLGSTVSIVGKPVLEEFRRTWKLHHPLEAMQIGYADHVAQVESVGFYHGANVLYQLVGIPGTWHECCLTSARGSRPA